MTFTIITKNNEKTFANKELVNISSRDGYDYKLDLGFDFMLTVEYNKDTNRYVLLNQFILAIFYLRDNRFLSVWK